MPACERWEGLALRQLLELRCQAGEVVKQPLQRLLDTAELLFATHALQAERGLHRGLRPEVAGRALERVCGAPEPRAVAVARFGPS